MSISKKQCRLIDANALRAYWLENGQNEPVYDTNAVLDSIDFAPTVDAEPVRHGRWIPDLASLDDANNMSCACSCCGKGDLSAITVVVPYCWYCGAKMDLEVPE